MDKSEKAIEPAKDYTREIIRYFVVFYKDCDEAEACKKIWDYFHKTNSERIWASEIQERIEILDSLTELRKNTEANYNIYSVFFDILAVETGLKKADKRYTESMKELSRALKKANLKSAVSLREVLFPEKVRMEKQKQQLKEQKKQAKGTVKNKKDKQQG